MEFVLSEDGKNLMNFVGKLENFKKTSIQSATKLVFHGKNYHTKINQNTNTTPNTTMTRQDKSLRKNMPKTLSILDINSENKQ